MTDDLAVAVVGIETVETADVPEDAIRADEGEADGASTFLVVADGVDTTTESSAIRLEFAAWSDPGTLTDLAVDVHLGDGGDPETMSLPGIAEAQCMTGGATSCIYYLVPETMPEDLTSVTLSLAASGAETTVIQSP